jgi:hypothetical protein
MLLDIHILYDALSSYYPQIETRYDGELRLRQARLIRHNSGVFDPDFIYLGMPEDIIAQADALAGVDLISLGAIGDVMLKNHDLSVIMVAETCSEAEVFCALQTCFDRYAQWESSMLKAVARNAPLVEMLQLAASELDNPIAVNDLSLRMIAMGGHLPSDITGTVWESQIEMGYTPSESWKLSSEDLYFFRSHGREAYIPHGLPYESQGYSHLVANIYLQNKLFALLCSSDTNAPFTKGQISLFQHVRDVMELSMVAGRGTAETVDPLYYYLNSLAHGQNVDEKVLDIHLSEMGWSCRGAYLVYAIGDEKGGDLDAARAEFALFRIRNIDIVAMPFYEDGLVGVICNFCGAPPERRFKYHQQLEQLLAGLNMHGGCSMLFTDIRNLRSMVLQSRAALRLPSRAATDSSIVDFQSVYFENLAVLLSEATDLGSLVHPGVTYIMSWDREHGTDLLVCLKNYLANGCNLNRTAKDRFMHRNTLAYRLSKIESILGFSLSEQDEKTRMQLWFSCCIVTESANTAQPCFARM